MFLMIENKGVAPYQSLLLFGSTGNRYSTNPLTIGTFGSGSKHGVGALLRAGVDLKIFAGLTKMEYFSKPLNVRQANGAINVQQQVCVHLSGKLPEDATPNERLGSKDLGFTLDFGAKDWPTGTGVFLACREFVSNAIDGQLEMTGDFDGVKIQIVDKEKVRAKDGYTRIFIEYKGDVVSFFSEIGKWFLHFSHPEWLKEKKKILPKEVKEGSPLIYRRGVLVRQIRSDNPSLFNYNLNDLELNEARTYDDWSANLSIARAYRAADRGELVGVLKAMVADENYWETKELNGAGLVPYNWEIDKPKDYQAEWQAAATVVLGDDGVFAPTTNTIQEMVARKGYRPLPIGNDNWLKMLTAIGGRTDDVILTKDDKEGRVFSEANDVALKVLDFVWAKFEGLDRTNGKEKPACGLFSEPLNCESKAIGLYRPENKTVYLNKDIADVFSNQAVMVMVEEVVHHITGATDFSRDFQTFLVSVIGQIFSESLS